MVVEHTDSIKFGSSMSSCLPLPLLVFHHHPNFSQDDDDEEEDEMLMFSISNQILHKNMEHDGLLAAGNSSSMCWATPQGWILVLAQDHHDTAASSACCLWNPCTGDKLPLPEIVEEEEHQIPDHCKCLLSHKDPTHPGCVVVLFSQNAPEFWYCHTSPDLWYCHTGDNTGRWRHHFYDIGNYPTTIPKPPNGEKARRRIYPIEKIICDMASFRGKIYFSNWPNDMCAIDFSSCTSAAIDFSSCTSTPNHNDRRPKFEKFDISLVGLPEGLSSGKMWLVESRDQLFVVTIGFVDFDPNNIGAIEVHRMDFSSSTQDCSWRRVHDIGDVVFLLEDANMAASCSASALGLKGNQIFFMKNFMDDDGDLCIFDLGKNSQEITQVHNCEDLILCRKPFWIVPPS